MIPPFELRHGRAVLPPGGRTPTDVAEVEQRLVEDFPDSLTRRGLYQGWRERRAALADIIGADFVEWVSGSFVTGKVDPPDLDVAAFLDGVAFEALPPAEQRKASELLVGPGVKLVYGCHSFAVPVYPEGDPRHARYLRDRGAWDWQWSRDRVAGSKGYLEVRGQP